MICIDDTASFISSELQIQNIQYIMGSYIALLYGVAEKVVVQWNL